jgi:hypothetical protein
MHSKRSFDWISDDAYFTMAVRPVGALGGVVVDEVVVFSNSKGRSPIDTDPLTEVVLPARS